MRIADEGVGTPDDRPEQARKQTTMNTMIRGKAFVLGDNIDTDQIIPAKFLAYNPSDAAERKYFGMYAMDGLPKGRAGLPSGDAQLCAAQ